MVEKLEWEVSYLEKFLPQKLGEAETMALVQAADRGYRGDRYEADGNADGEGGRPESRHG